MPSSFHSTYIPTWSGPEDEKCSKEDGLLFRKNSVKSIPSLNKLETIPEDTVDAIITPMKEAELDPGTKKKTESGHGLLGTLSHSNGILKKSNSIKSIELSVHPTPTTVYTCLSDPRPLEVKHMFQANPNLLDAIFNALELGVQRDLFTKVLYSCRSTIPDWPWVHRLAIFLHDVPPLFESLLQMIGWIGGRVSIKNINASSISPSVRSMALYESRSDPLSCLPFQPPPFHFLGMYPPISTPQTLTSYPRSFTPTDIVKTVVNGESRSREERHLVTEDNEISHLSYLVEPTVQSIPRFTSPSCSSSSPPSIPSILKSKPALVPHLDGPIKKRAVMTGSPLMPPVCSKLVATHFSISTSALPINSSPLMKSMSPTLSVSAIANAEEGFSEKSSIHFRSIQNGGRGHS